MIKPILLAVFIGSFLQFAFAQENNTSISPAQHAPHIAYIKNDSLIVVAGSTYRFTVDTPEDKGLVSTIPSVNELLSQLVSKNGKAQQYRFIDKKGDIKVNAQLETGDKLIVAAADGKTTRTLYIGTKALAIGGLLSLKQSSVTANTNRALTLCFTAGQRSPDVTVRINIPAGINVTMENTSVNVIGRGKVLLKDLATQSIGRTGNKYSYTKVGDVTISKTKTGSLLVFSHLDLRPANGPDLEIVINDVKLSKAGTYIFTANYSTSKPEALTSAGNESASLKVVNTISDFEKVTAPLIRYKEDASTFTTAIFRWTSPASSSPASIMQSHDEGKTWRAALTGIDIKKGNATVTALQADKKYLFRLATKQGATESYSNIVEYYSGKHDIKSFGTSGKDSSDNTDQVNKAIAYIHKTGGGILRFSKGVYHVRTVHMQSNVWLYIDEDATLKALKGGDAPETTWFSDKKYRSGLSPTDMGPYDDPENYMTKQDVGHHYFRNCMFFGERLDNVKIIGNGVITGNGNLVTGDRVMNNAADNRSDKMFVFKLCTNIEIGGLYREEDLWYDSAADKPVYLNKSGAPVSDVSNMLKIDRGGHFVLLATGTDNIYVHDTWFARDNRSNARDIYDFMGCNNVTATNIYSAVSSDDIIKPGSDCSLGFTRPAKNYKVRNIIGDTNCNLFQIGSETVDDITDICVDNIYILGANKAGFSISTNDGALIRNIHLNCGHTGTIHSRSKMYRSFAPFFISISNRGRVIGAEAGKYEFTENGEKHNELLIKNINIGKVENIIINGIDVYEVYGGSSHSGTRWKAFDGSQRRATPIIAGYSLPDPSVVKGGLDFKLPNGLHTGYITNIVFNDVNILVKGGNSLSDTAASPPELGVGQYNASNLKVQPSYGIWARHVEGLTIQSCSFNYEKRDSRYTFFLDDVKDAKISLVKTVCASDNETVIKLKNSSNVSVDNITFYKDEWGKSPVVLPPAIYTAGMR
jgi:polygalacturonase